MWAADIATFNSAAKQPINIIFTYGGDMEYWPSPGKSPFYTYFDESNQQGKPLNRRFYHVKQPRIRSPTPSQLLQCMRKPLGSSTLLLSSTGEWTAVTRPATTGITQTFHSSQRLKSTSGPM